MQKQTTNLREFILSTLFIIIMALFSVTLMKVLFFEIYRVPSQSMEITLLPGDYVFSSKYNYGYSKHSLPNFIKNFIKNFTHKDIKINEHYPERGDIIIFKSPKEDNLNFVKRTIGLPGDKVQIINGYIYLNNKKIVQERYIITQPELAKMHKKNQFFEEIIDDKKYSIVIKSPRYSRDNNTEIFYVPEGHVFVLGDNRSRSLDSRFINQVGFIPSSHIIGKVHYICFSKEIFDKTGFIKSMGGFRWYRFFSKIH